MAPQLIILFGKTIKEMHLNQRLNLILEAVTYCQKVKALEMPARCYTKALREPVFFLWELRHTNKKIQAAKYRSSASLGVQVGGGGLIYDHAIPFVYLQRELLGLMVPTRESIHAILKRYGTACLITKDEDNRLNQAGLGRAMPTEWDGCDVLARYHFLQIEILSNPDNQTVRAEQGAPSNR